MRTKKRQIGDVGEELVCRYLQKEGYRVLGRNYLKPWGEIDIIAEKANILRFIEVKSVSRESLKDISRESLRPEENFHKKKLERLNRTVQTYLLEHRLDETTPWQIDLACAYLDFSAKKARVELFENAVL